MATSTGEILKVRQQSSRTGRPGRGSGRPGVSPGNIHWGQQAVYELSLLIDKIGPLVEFQ